MKIMILYDSVLGNTEKIAHAISDSFGSHADVKTFRVSDIQPDNMIGLDLLIVGSPTRAFRPTMNIIGFLNGIPSCGLKDIKVAAFDTRVSYGADKKAQFANILFRHVGYAAGSIADKLVKKGGTLIVPPMGFILKGSEGPLKAGELERAADWTKSIMKA
ncbi:flavodoxin family protein [Methanomethylovorans sp.]|uniref:flavodoxin family protein n=1 Tax=Methanomethylovorans sp. TaxID=2758717 RepID=UPI00351CA9AB